MVDIISCSRCNEPAEVPLPTSDSAFVCRGCLTTEDVIALLELLGLDARPEVRRAIEDWRLQAVVIDAAIT